MFTPYRGWEKDKSGRSRKGVCGGGLSGQGDKTEGGRSAGQHVVHYREDQEDGRKPGKTPALLKS